MASSSSSTYSSLKFAPLTFSVSRVCYRLHRHRWMAPLKYLYFFFLTASAIGIERSFIKVIIEEKLRLSFGCLDDCRMNLRGIQVEIHRPYYLLLPDGVHRHRAGTLLWLPSSLSFPRRTLCSTTIHLNIQTKNLYHATGESFMYRTLFFFFFLLSLPFSAKVWAFHL